MKAHKTEHMLVGAIGVFRSEVFDHRSLRMEYLFYDGMVFVNEETMDNTIAAWAHTYDYEPIDNYPDDKVKS